LVSLYLDTSSKLTIGILDYEYNWVEYSPSEDQKSSGVIHHRIDELIVKNHLKIKDFKKLFIINGPGSYTGVRVGEGLGQIFELEKIETFSFHHFQVPFLAGIIDGIFVCPAFKGEYFVYEWHSNDHHRKLVSEVCADKIYGDQIFSNQDCSKILSEVDVKNTNEILFTESIKIFSSVVDLRLRTEPFYFRELNDEFKKRGNNVS